MGMDSQPYQLVIEARHAHLGIEVGSVATFDPSAPPAAPGEIVSILFNSGRRDIARLATRPGRGSEEYAAVVDAADGGLKYWFARAVRRVDKLVKVEAV